MRMLLKKANIPKFLKNPTYSQSIKPGIIPTDGIIRPIFNNIRILKGNSGLKLKIFYKILNFPAHGRFIVPPDSPCHRIIPIMGIM
jgi:hypothetical protein